MKFKFILFILLLFSFASFIYAQEKNGGDERPLPLVFDILSPYLHDATEYDTSYKNLLESYEFEYTRPYFSQPVMRVLHPDIKDYIYYELPVKELVVLDGENSKIAEEDYWNKIFGGMGRSPYKFTRRLRKFVETDKNVIALYGTPSMQDGETMDMVIFDKKNNVLYPAAIYPQANAPLKFGLTRLEVTEGDTIKVSSTGGDEYDIWGVRKYFILKESEPRLVKKETLNGYYHQTFTSSGKERFLYGEGVIATSFDNAGKETHKNFYSSSEFENGEKLFVKAKHDSLQLYEIDINDPYSPRKEYKKVETRNRVIKIVGPVFSRYVFIEWEGKTYIVNNNMLNL